MSHAVFHQEDRGNKGKKAWILGGLENRTQQDHLQWLKGVGWLYVIGVVMEKPVETRVETLTAPCLGLLADWFHFPSAFPAGSRDSMGFSLLGFFTFPPLPRCFIDSLIFLLPWQAWASCHSSRSCTGGFFGGCIARAFFLGNSWSV